MTEWKDITDPKKLFNIDQKKWEIECNVQGEDWFAWNGSSWHKGRKFRARPNQPKMKKVKIYGYLNIKTGRTYALLQGQKLNGTSYVRYTKLDDEIEVPE